MRHGVVWGRTVGGGLVRQPGVGPVRGGLRTGPSTTG